MVIIIIIKLLYVSMARLHKKVPKRKDYSWKFRELCHTLNNNYPFRVKLPYFLNTISQIIENLFAPQ